MAQTSIICLRPQNRDLDFTGIATEIGVESSVRDSLNLGYYTVVASDSCSSANREGHEAALKSMGSVAIIETTKYNLNIRKVIILFCFIFLLDIKNI